MAQTQHETIARQFALAREAAGKTQSEVASHLGVTYQAVSNWERGQTKIDSVSLIRALRFFGADVYEFLAACGFDDLPRSDGAREKKAPSVSDGAMKVARAYDKLDRYGRDAVQAVAAAEKRRCADEERFLRETAAPWEQPERRVINLYLDGSAAGPLQGITGQESEPYTLTDDDPKSASYAVKVSGDSMEPYFPDGSVAFVDHEPMRDGDVGIFCVDGKNIVKQWHYDAALGVTYLFSLNRARADADVILTPGDPRYVVCQGRVIADRRFPLPR